MEGPHTGQAGFDIFRSPDMQDSLDALIIVHAACLALTPAWLVYRYRPAKALRNASPLAIRTQQHRSLATRMDSLERSEASRDDLCYLVEMGEMGVADLRIHTIQRKVERVDGSTATLQTINVQQCPRAQSTDLAELN
ncbi:hypothetical protein VCV18_004152 [Metarhizium anisopliae]